MTLGCLCTLVVAFTAVTFFFTVTGVLVPCVHSGSFTMGCCGGCMPRTGISEHVYRCYGRSVRPKRFIIAGYGRVVRIFY